MQGKYTITRIFRLAVVIFAIKLAVPVQGLADAKPDLIIGGIYSLSGYGAVAGTSEMQAAQMAISEINSAGGIRGHKINFVVEDNRSETKETARAFLKLTQVNQAQFILGPNWGEFSEVAAPMADQHKIIMITPSGYTDSLNSERSHVFTMLPSHRAAVRPALEFVSRHKAKKIIVLYSNNAYFESMRRAFVALLSENMLEPLASYGFNQQDLDYRSTISRIKKMDPDLVVSFLMEGATASFIKQAREQKFDFSRLLYATGLPYDEVILANKSLANGITFFDYFDNGSADFRKRFYERYKVQSQLGTSKSYDSVYTLKAAIEKCGLQTSEVLRCLKTLEFSGVTGQIKFDKNGRFTGSSEITKLFKVQAGKFIELSKASDS